MTEKMSNVIVCPACGFQFKVKQLQDEIECPKCGYTFKSSPGPVGEPDTFMKRKI